MSTTRKICCKKCGAEAEFTSLEIQALRNLDKRASEWVSVDDRLPEVEEHSPYQMSDQVIVSDGIDVTTGYYCLDGSWDTAEDLIAGVLLWAHLPSPPRRRVVVM